jgi:hypothetical protein
VNSLGLAAAHTVDEKTIRVAETEYSARGVHARFDPFDAWMKASTWWLDPKAWTDPSKVLGTSPERMLFDLIEGIARRFTGRRLDLNRHGSILQFAVDSLRMGRAESGDDVEVHVEAHDVDWSGWRFQRVAAVARGVRLAGGRPARLSSESVEISAHAPRDTVSTWAQNVSIDNWALSATDDGYLVAHSHQRPVELVVSPTIALPHAELELREVMWRGRRLRVPHWLRLTRRVPLPALPHGVELLDAWPEAGGITFRARLPGFEERLDLERVRDAVLKGEPNFTLGSSRR